MWLLLIKFFQFIVVIPFQTQLEEILSQPFGLVLSIGPSLYSFALCKSQICKLL